MITVCWSPKGGTGTSVVAVGLAIAHNRCEGRNKAVIVDLAGDIPAILAMDGTSIGVSEWIAEPSACDLNELLVEYGESLRVLPRGHSHLPEHRSGAWSRLALELEALSKNGSIIVVDAGIGPIPVEFEPLIDHSYLVVRPCYLALRRARLIERSPRAHVSPELIVVSEPNRVLTFSDIESVLGYRIAAKVRLDPDVARRVDAGVISMRPPKQLMEDLTPLVETWIRT